MTDISELLLDFERNLGQLEEERNAYNQAVTDEVSIKAELNDINDEIAYWDVYELSRVYDSKVLEQKAAEQACTAAHTVLEGKQRTIVDLNAQRNSISIAIDEINAGLKYVFFAENRIPICVDGEKYKLLCNGCPVKPKDVSAGERNVIGLCYFFTSILAGKRRETAHSEEYLLIIDDPVSSFDFKNRIGILSYLKYELGRFLL